MPLNESNRLLPAGTDWQGLDRNLLGDVSFSPPAFPLNILSSCWRIWIEDSAPTFGSANYLAHCLLGGVAGVAGAGLRIGVGSHWVEPLILWQALVGGPASGRTAAFARVHALLEGLWPDEGEGDAAAGLPVSAPESGTPVVLVDAGLDRLSSAVSQSAGGVLLWRENLGDWRAEAGRRQAWRSAWSAAPATIDFRSHDCFAVGLMGALSPDGLAAFTRGDGARGRTGEGSGGSSLASRFLYAWPERGVPASLADVESDDAGLVVLLRKIAGLAGAREAPTVVPLDAEGARRLEALMPEVRRLADEAADSGAGSVAAEWLARGVSNIVRLAGVLSLMEWAETDAEYLPVGAGHIEAAHALWSGYYLPQAMAVFDRAGARAGDQAARRVVRWLRRVRAPLVSREEVRREALCQSVSAEVAEEVLARLEAGGVLREVAVKEATRRGPRRRRWEVNPALAGNSANSASALGG